jgi:hypothetical protein
MEDNLKKNKKWKTTSKKIKMEDNLNKIYWKTTSEKNGRQLKKKWKTTFLKRKTT